MSLPIVQLLGIPYDGKSSFLKGPAQAPSVIRQIFHNGSSNYWAENGVDIEHDMLLEDKGDVIFNTYMEIEEEIRRKLIPDQACIFVGGDHSITYPIVQFMHRFHGPFDLLVFDAHTDMYDSFNGDPYSHACPFARIMEEKLLNRLVQVGLRSVPASQKMQAEKFGVELIPMWEIQKLHTLKFNRPLYISIDLDGFDPAFAPGVSHHEPGGLSSRQVLNYLHSLTVPIIGADIVELNPIRDHQQITAALAAKLLKELAGLIVKNTQ